MVYIVYIGYLAFMYWADEAKDCIVNKLIIFQLFWRLNAFQILRPIFCVFVCMQVDWLQHNFKKFQNVQYNPKEGENIGGIRYNINFWSYDGAFVQS